MRSARPLQVWNELAVDEGRVTQRVSAAWPQPLQPRIAVAVTLRRTTTVTHERSPAAWDTKPEAHQRDVPTSRTDTQNAFLCRTASLTDRASQNDADLIKPLSLMHDSALANWRV